MRAYIISVVGTGWCCCCCLCRQEGSDLHICKEKKKKKGNFPTCFISLEDHFNGDPKRCPRYLVNILLKNSWNYRRRNRGKREGERELSKDRENRVEGKKRLDETARLPVSWMTYKFKQFPAMPVKNIVLVRLQNLCLSPNLYSVC